MTDIPSLRSRLDAFSPELAWVRDLRAKLDRIEAVGDQLEGGEFWRKRKLEEIDLEIARREQKR